MMRYFRYLVVVVMLLTIMPFAVLAKSAFKLNQEGIKYYQNKQFDQSEAVFAQALSKAPESEKIYYNLGNVFYQKGQYDKSIALYNRARQGMALSEDAGGILKNIGHAHYSAMHYQEAIKNYKAHLKSRPDDMDAKLFLELALLKLKENTSSTPNPTEDTSEDTPSEEGSKNNNASEREQTEQLLNLLDKAEQDARERHQNALPSAKINVEMDW